MIEDNDLILNFLIKFSREAAMCYGLRCVWDRFSSVLFYIFGFQERALPV